MKKVLFLQIISMFLALPFIANAQTTRQTSYGRVSQDITLDLNWDDTNYGDIQWQTSTDNGLTWTDISGENASSYTFRLNADALYRAHVIGDPSCPPIDLERELKTINFNALMSNIGYNSAKILISSADFRDANIVEYGYAVNMSSLSRLYTMMPLEKVGTTIPGTNFDVLCNNLRPNTTYSIRFYVKTADGSVVFGPGKLVTTSAGIEFSSENWVIETTRMQAKFMLSGTATVSNVTCSYGLTTDNMVSSTVSDLGNGNYSSGYFTNLTPGTKYFVKISALVNGIQQEQIRELSTMTDYSQNVVDTSIQSVAHRINWGSIRTLTRISDPNISATEYPRICRIDDNTLLLTYHGGTTTDQWQNGYYRLSYDNGKTWQPQVMIFDKTKTFLGSAYFRISNPEATLLDNGWVILSATANGNPETNDNCKTICIISKDKCQTWSDPIIIGRGRGWEPHVVQLPGGELELLVSSEKAWWRVANTQLDQEIVCARSTDHGQTWTAFKRASYLQGARDGMPVPVVLKGNKGVMFTIESPSGGVSPSIVYRSLDKEWDATPWDRVNDNLRWATGLNVGGGAPFCVQLPTGELVVSCHTNQAGSVWQTSRPQVCLLDSSGHNPKYFTLPCTTGNPLGANEGAYYNSLFVKDAEHIWLLVTRVTYNGTTRGVSTIEYMEGTIIPY